MKSFPSNNDGGLGSQKPKRRIVRKQREATGSVLHTPGQPITWIMDIPGLGGAFSFRFLGAATGRNVTNPRIACSHSNKSSCKPAPFSLSCQKAFATQQA